MKSSRRSWAENPKGDPPCRPVPNRSRSSSAALVAFVAANAPAHTQDDFAVNLGPVPPYEPILTSMGDKRVVAFYVPEGIHCAVYASVWDDQTDSAVRVRVSLDSNKRVQIDAAKMLRLSQSSTTTIRSL